MPINRLLELFRRKSAEFLKTDFEKMRDALKPDKTRSVPPAPPTKFKIRKRN